MHTSDSSVLCGKQTKSFTEKARDKYPACTSYRLCTHTHKHTHTHTHTHPWQGHMYEQTIHTSKKIAGTQKVNVDE